MTIIRPTMQASRPARLAKKAAEFKRRRQELNQMQSTLTKKALLESPPAWRVADSMLLQKRGWIFPTPRPLESIEIGLLPSEPDVQHLRDKARTIRGIDEAGPVLYTEAMAASEGAFWYTDGIIYRPLEVATDQRGHLVIAFSTGRYFDYLNTGERLAYDYLVADRSSRRHRAQADAFDLRNRVASLGILTLTIIRDHDSASFLMHKRTSRIILGRDLYHVVPAGEFTPSDIGLTAIEDDFDLMRNIWREYAEELLGDNDAQGQGGKRIDYATASPYKELQQGLSSGGLRLFTFGLGLDPLTWKPELLSVAVFDGATFAACFPGPLAGSHEGTLLSGIPFTEKEIRRYVESDATRPGAKECLRLAWKNRDLLGI